jgi:hypothetical protein
LFQPRQVGVKFFKHALLTMLDLVLRSTASAAPQEDRSRI